MSQFFACFVSLIIQYGAMAKFWPLIAPRMVNVWERIGEKTLSTILHRSWERGRVNLIFSTNLAGDVR